MVAMRRVEVRSIIMGVGTYGLCVVLTLVFTSSHSTACHDSP